MIEVENQQGRLQNGNFTLCFGHDGGYIGLGGYNTELHLSKFKTQVFKFNPSQDQYKITLDSIWVEKSKIR